MSAAAPNAALGPAEVHRRVVELYNSGRGEEGFAYVAPDVIDHFGGTVGDQYGFDAWVRNREGLGADFRDVSVTIEQNLECGDISSNRYASRGTHIPSGRSYEVTGMDMIRVRDGQIVEHWAVMDGTAMRHQLGLPASFS